MESSSIFFSKLVSQDAPTKDTSKTLLLKLATHALQHAWYALAVLLTALSAARALSSQVDLASTHAPLDSTLHL